MIKPLYSTGSASLAADAPEDAPSGRRPNKALRKDITASVPCIPTCTLTCTCCAPAADVTAHHRGAHALLRRCPNAEGLLGDLLPFDFRSAKSRGLRQARAVGDHAVRLPLYRARRGQRRF